MATPAFAAAEDDDATIAALIAARDHLPFDAFDGLLMEGVPLNRVADVLGTPAWVYSAGAIRRRLKALTEAMAGLARVHYAVKANDHLAVLPLMAAGGAGADVVSEGELRRARRSGFAAGDIVFSGVGKTAREISPRAGGRHRPAQRRECRGAGRSAALAAAAGRTARVALRVNPDVDAGTHAKITTGTADEQVRHPAGRGRRRSTPAPPRCPGWRRSGWRCTWAARSSPSRPIAPRSRAWSNWCAR